MNLSKKGQNKLSEFLYVYGAYVTGLRFFAPAQIEFEPDDFEGAVVLTVEEAKEIIGSYIGTQWQIIKKNETSELRMKNATWLISLVDRIAQAEKEK